MNFLFSKEWNELKKFQKLDKKEKLIVFYAENKASINHFRDLIYELTEKRNKEICYVTSVENDPFCNEINKNIKYFFIGDGIARTKFFLELDSKILITDMPDLGRFHIKRSKIYDVHYIYLFHSMFSTHTYLRHEALDDYDTIFCVGQYQIKEIQKTEKIYDLRSKKLIEYGFGRLDFLLKNRNERKIPLRKIIISPSYGENNFLKKCGMDLIEKLLELKYIVILRPHFKIIKEENKLIKKIKSKFEDNENFIYNDGIISIEDFEESECLISDWSGISMEYAFVYEKPVIFMDVPQKIKNKNFHKLEIEPIEVSIRNKIGKIIQCEEISKIEHIIGNIQNNISINEITSLRENLIFNLKKSNKIGADYIESLLGVDNE